MFEKIIRFAIEQRWFVMLGTVGLIALGIYSYQKLPIDAVPDITNVQVQINTSLINHAGQFWRGERVAIKTFLGATDGSWLIKVEFVAGHQARLQKTLPEGIKPEQTPLHLTQPQR